MASQSGGAPSAKVVMLGAQSVGKTCLTIRLVDGKFSENEMTTIGAAYKQKKVSERVLDIWDTAGQERYAAIAPLYYRGAQAAVIVYDVGNRKSFTKAGEWLKKLRAETDEDLVLGLASNKSDIPDNKRQVTEAEAEEYAKANNMIHYSTSAKTGAGVNELFEEIVTRLPSKKADTALKMGMPKTKSKSCC